LIVPAIAAADFPTQHFISFPQLLLQETFLSAHERYLWAATYYYVLSLSPVKTENPNKQQHDQD
jgi:hypothetical protein